MEQILETGQKMGLNGEKVQGFVIEEQKRAEREAQAERQFNLQREKMKYDHDQAMEKIRQEQAHKPRPKCTFKCYHARTTGI